MKKITVFLLMMFYSMMILAVETKPIATTIGKINRNPDTLLNQVVQIDVRIDNRLTSQTATVSHYRVTGEYEGEYMIIHAPFSTLVIGEKYRITGVLYEATNRQWFINASNFYIIDDFNGNVLGYVDPAGQPQISEDTPATLPIETQKKGFFEEYKDIILIIAAALILIIAIIIIVMLVKKGSSQPAPAPTVTPTPPIPTRPVYNDDFATVKIPKDVTENKTLRFIRGVLTITSGEDKGKSFRLAGHEANGAFVVTMGTKEADPGKEHAHILIDRKFKTVSRRQAEFIYKPQEEKLFVKNLSTVNYTVVDGRELAPTEMAEVKNGSVIRTGELEFKYSY
jgi:hypothetical protein